MGSFRLANSTSHLDEEFNFIGSKLETVGSRYIICARRNLPDKEFRYLRTLIVRAAVYRRLYYQYTKYL